MAKKLSQVAISLLSLLNNADELIVRSNNRKDAKEVIKALTIYASAKSFILPKNKIQNLNDTMLDYPPYKISYLIKDIANDVAKSGMI